MAGVGGGDGGETVTRAPAAGLGPGEAAEPRQTAAWPRAGAAAAAVTHRPPGSTRATRRHGSTSPHVHTVATALFNCLKLSSNPEKII